MRRVALGVIVASSVTLGLPLGAAGSVHRGLSSLRTGHSGSMSIMTVSRPPSIARIHPMRWARWTPSPRMLQSRSQFGSRAVIGVTSAGVLAAVEADYGITASVPLPALRAAEISVDDASLKELLTKGAHDPRIRYVEPINSLAYDHARNDPYLTTLNPAINAPWEWQFGASHVDLALNLEQGSPSVIVGVVDSGVADVPDLKGKVPEGWYFTSEGIDAVDIEGHGTAVSSLIAANNDDGVGMGGFGGRARVIVFRVVNLTTIRVAAAIDRLVSRGVRIINLSLGSPQYSSVEADAINRAISAGILVVASSGNESAFQVSYPAALLQPINGAASYGLAVGSSNANSGVSSFSNKGDHLSLVAPGNYAEGVCGGVFAAIPTPARMFDGTCTPEYSGPTGARYAYVAGTSFSAPEVAGVAALVWAARPDLKNYEIAEIIKQSAYRAPGTGWGPVGGWGVLNAAHALELATGRSAADSLLLGSLSAPSSIAGGARLSVSAHVSWQDGATLPSGTTTCSASVAGTALAAATATTALGAVSCEWDIPLTAGGQTLTGSIAVTEPGSGLSVTSQQFQTAVTDVLAPTVIANAAAGRWGKSIQLSFVPSEETGGVSTSLVVLKGGIPVMQRDTPLTTITSGQAYKVSWRTPAKKAKLPFRFCVTVKDATGNSSARSCAPIAIR
jgi:subtilisin family serine protease